MALDKVKVSEREVIWELETQAEEMHAHGHQETANVTATPANKKRINALTERCLKQQWIL